MRAAVIWVGRWVHAGSIRVVQASRGTADVEEHA